jgi:hypothetical protein
MIYNKSSPAPRSTNFGVLIRRLALHRRRVSNYPGKAWWSGASGEPVPKEMESTDRNDGEYHHRTIADRTVCVLCPVGRIAIISMK